MCDFKKISIMLFFIGQYAVSNPLPGSEITRIPTPQIVEVEAAPASTAGSIINVPKDYSAIQAAIAAASDGDTILVAPGIYPGAINMAAAKSVVLASWFLTTRDTSYISRTILDGQNGSAVITIASSAGPATMISGFTIQNADDGILPYAKFNILNCRIISCSDGIDYDTGSGGLCKFNLIENNSDDGIDLDYDVDLVIEGNTIRNNNDDGIEIRLNPYKGPLLNYVIRNNEIYGNDEDGIQLIDYNTLSNRIFVIEGNLIYNNRMAGLGCMGGANTSENFEGASIPERIFLFNNTFAANAYGVTGGDNLVAFNNIFVGHFTLAMKNVDAGSIVAYGIYWNNGANFENCNVDSANIMRSDPLFDARFHLQPTSPAIDAGIAFFNWHGETVLNRPSSSYNGKAPDLGAFEFGGTSIPSLAIGDVMVTEGNAGTVNATFTVTLSFASTETVMVNYATADGTATAPDDYNAVALTTLNFAPGTTTQTIAVVIKADEIGEPNETFVVNLSNAINAFIVDNQGKGTILNDDCTQPISVSFQDGVNGYNGTRDTKLLKNMPSTNYGSDIRLEADGTLDRSALLYWDLAGIPSRSIIRSVDLTLNVNNKSVDTYEIYELKRPWVEGEATWNEFASGQSWQVAGADGSEDRGTAALGVMADSSEGLITFSLNSLGVAVVQSWVDNPAANHGFIILDYINTHDGLDFSSRENVTVAKHPKLTVTYDCAGPVTTVKTPAFPQESQLHQNYPNPFNPTTRISYSLRESGFVSLKIYDVLGKELQALVNEFQAAGTYSVELDANKLSSGTYFYTLRIGDDFVETRKMLFLR